MDFKYIFVYCSVNFFCVITMLTILSKLGISIGSDMEVKLFRRMSISFIIFLLMDMVWALTMGRAILLPLQTGGIIKILGTMFIPLMVYFWFLFAETRFRNPMVPKRGYRLLVSVPLIIMALLYGLSAYNGIVMSADVNGDIIPGPLVGLTGIVDNLYGAAIIAHAAILLSKEKIAHRRVVYRDQIIFIIICTIGGITDAVMQNTPVMPLAITLSYIYLFSNLQEGQIYNDALTGLNNRRRADIFIDDAIRAVTQETPFYLFMVDIDNFKQINDTKGHLEGDRALQAVARAMSMTADTYNGFTARWGGDEFIILIHEKDHDFPNVFQQELESNMEKALKERSIPYSLAVSSGYARCSSHLQRTPDLISIADRTLYQKKNRTITAFRTSAS